MKLILFDFDGTITTRDTLMEFTRAAVGDVRFLLGLLFLSPPLVLQKAGLISAQKAKEIFLSHFFKNLPSTEFEIFCRNFTEKKLPALIRPGALEAIKNYKARNERVIIVSASPFQWITPWATTLGLEVLSTKLEITDGKLTGRIQGKNCNKEEKVIRVKQHLTLSDYNEVVVYGDTSGDLAMLDLATEKHYKPFRN